MNAIEKYNMIRDRESEEQLKAKQKLRRQITDYLCKYADYEQLTVIANFLGIEIKGDITK